MAVSTGTKHTSTTMHNKHIPCSQPLEIQDATCVATVKSHISAHKIVSYTYAGGQQPKIVHKTQHGRLHKPALCNLARQQRCTQCPKTCMQYNYIHSRQAGRWAKALTSGRAMEKGGCCNWDSNIPACHATLSKQDEQHARWINTGVYKKPARYHTQSTARRKHSPVSMRQAEARTAQNLPLHLARPDLAGKHKPPQKELFCDHKTWVAASADSWLHPTLTQHALLHTSQPG